MEIKAVAIEQHIFIFFLQYSFSPLQIKNSFVLFGEIIMSGFKRTKAKLRVFFIISGSAV